MTSRKMPKVLAFTSWFGKAVGRTRRPLTPVIRGRTIAYISGHKLVKYSVWREVDPARVIAPGLNDVDTEDYAKLCAPQNPNQILLHISRDKGWLLDLWGIDNKVFLRYLFLSFIMLLL